jgi:hypothetical protein
MAQLGESSAPVIGRAPEAPHGEPSHGLAEPISRRN